MPAPTTYTSEQLFATRDELTIYGQLFRPAKVAPDEPLPTLVCAHGFGSNYLSCVPYAWALAEQGVAVYCFDFCGGGYASRSEGNPLEMTVATERDDIHAVFQMLAQQIGVDSSRLFLFGEDQGGLAAVLYAHEHAQELTGLVLVHPTLNLHDQTRALFPTTKNIPPSYRQLGMRVGRAYGELAWTLNPYEYMQGFSHGVLIVHGDEDTSVPLDYSHRAAAVYPHARLQVIHGGKHIFRGETQRQSIDAVSHFIGNRLRGGVVTPA